MNPTITGDTYSYDTRGNLTARSIWGYTDGTSLLETFSYSGDRLSSCSRTQVIPQPGGRPVILSSSGSFVHDVRGRMTDDGMAETEMNYNLLDLPRSIVKNNTTLVKYSYLVDGMKTSALKSDGTGLVYRGGMVFLRAANGALSFESAPFTAGRMTADGIRYHVTDHLGSVRAVLNGSNGEIIEASDYAAYGDRTDRTSTVCEIWDQRPSLSTLPARDHFSGKEDQSVDFTVPYTDFGARQYSPSLRRWLVPDPMGEKYYDVSPYVYCHDDPIGRIDFEGAWDITIHVYSDREEYGYGEAIVTDRNGEEVFRFKVRVEGIGGRDRMQEGADTPLGIYDIPDDCPWMSGGNRASYGPNHRLVLVGISGEIADSGRTEIRIHGGRQEVWDNRTKQWIPVENPVLEKTYGCIRAFDKDMKKLKRITDKLSQNDRKEKPGQVSIVDDLIKTPVYENPLSLNIIDYSYREKPQETTWDMIIDSIIKYGYYSAGQ